MKLGKKNVIYNSFIIILAFEGSHHQNEWIGDPADLFSDQGNLTALDCPQFSQSSEQLVAQFSFWIEGVTQVITAAIKQC